MTNTSIGDISVAIVLVFYIHMRNSDQKHLLKSQNQQISELYV